MKEPGRNWPKFTGASDDAVVRAERKVRKLTRTVLLENGRKFIARLMKVEKAPDELGGPQLRGVTQTTEAALWHIPAPPYSTVERKTKGDCYKQKC